MQIGSLGAYRRNGHRLLAHGIPGETEVHHHADEDHRKRQTQVHFLLARHSRRIQTVRQYKSDQLWRGRKGQRNG